MTTPSGNLLDRRALAARREALVLRSAELRARLGADSGVFQPVLRLADRARAGAEVLSAHRPAILLAVAALLGAAVLRPRQAVGLGVRTVAIWQFAQHVRPVVRTVWRLLVAQKPKQP
jgi:hypothetical protein